MMNSNWLGGLSHATTFRNRFPSAVLISSSLLLFAPLGTPTAVTAFINRTRWSSTPRLLHRVFATISETGLPKMESFAPTGGGTDHPGTLAHVTVAHHLDPALRDMIYKGNPASFLLFCVDLMTHCGRNTQNDEHTLEFGMARESYWRAPRTACGAIVGCLNAYDHENAVHRRLRDHLGEANFQFLKNKDEANRVLSDNNPQLKGLTYLVAAAIVSIYGCVNTLREFAHQMDERGVATCTASITVNRPGSSETIFYLCRGTTFQDVVQYQGFGMDATKYRASIVKHRVELKYDGQGGADGVFPVIREELPRPAAGHGHGGH
eukprot:gnl/Spiro4/7615_TR4001_c0_g1_i1.p1 gnl/Spiro4/7615_TR4001_c0_g1~~gnl/Spiro4/7615_TR4001_c0_g1_i1.p1  ORF type:complete len:321 (+),score=104.83 gnl/Spiro4/7615_TR4001_c0_g1_i1:266-1228(+)